MMVRKIDIGMRSDVSTLKAYVFICYSFYIEPNSCKGKLERVEEIEEIDEVEEWSRSRDWMGISGRGSEIACTYLVLLLQLHHIVIYLCK